MWARPASATARLRRARFMRRSTRRRWKSCRWCWWWPTINMPIPRPTARQFACAIWRTRRSGYGVDGARGGRHGFGGVSANGGPGGGAGAAGRRAAIGRGANCCGCAATGNMTTPHYIDARLEGFAAGARLPAGGGGAAAGGKAGRTPKRLAAWRQEAAQIAGGDGGQGATGTGARTLTRKTGARWPRGI